MFKNQNFLPEIILVNTQLPENLGAVARAMLNFSFTNLRIVKPKFNLKNEKILPVSAGADKVIKKIKIFNKFEDSIKDLNLVIATSNRMRAIKKPVITFDQIIKKICSSKKKTGIIFGPENAGLDNDCIALSDSVLKIDTNPNFSSLNLSHAVIIVCFQIMKNLSKKKNKIEKLIFDSDGIAQKKELINFYSILNHELEKSGFFLVKEKKKITMQKIKNIFGRASLSYQEIKTLIGMIKSISKPNK